jgi:hypothetical protein
LGHTPNYGIGNPKLQKIVKFSVKSLDIERREALYAQNMVWLFDTREAVERESLEISSESRQRHFPLETPEKVNRLLSARCVS